MVRLRGAHVTRRRPSGKRAPGFVARSPHGICTDAEDPTLLWGLLALAAQAQVPPTAYDRTIDLVAETYLHPEALDPVRLLQARVDGDAYARPDGVDDVVSTYDYAADGRLDVIDRTFTNGAPPCSFLYVYEGADAFPEQLDDGCASPPVRYTYSDVQRSTPMWWLLALFVVAALGLWLVRRALRRRFAHRNADKD